MPWFKVDDKFHSHPKVMELTTGAVGLWTLAGTWCADYLTDGEIRRGQIRRLGGSESEAQELVEAGLWITTEDGYQFENWNDYQPTRESVEGEREAARERQRKRREQREKNKRDNKSVTEGSQRDTGVTHTPVRGEFVTPVPEPVPEVPKGTSKTMSTADADGPCEEFELAVIDQPEPTGPTTDELFTRFWDEYPRKEGKTKARDAFAKAIKRADPRQIIEGAHRYTTDPNRSPSFTKLAKTWLNGDHWQDPPLPPREDGTGPRKTAYERELEVSAQRHEAMSNYQPVNPNDPSLWQPKGIDA